MHIHFDINHPADVHFFKHTINELKNRGYIITISARDKDVTQELLDILEFEYYNKGKGSKNLIGKLLCLPIIDIKLLIQSLKSIPDIFISFASPYAAQVAYLLRRPHIAFDDTENAQIAQRFYRPFSKVILSPSCYKGKVHKKQIFFNSYKELAYLHSDYFIPSSDIFDFLKLRKDEKYIILRFVSTGANHDIGNKKLSNEFKIHCVEELSKLTKVFISSEQQICNQLSKYQIHIPVNRMHDALAYCTLLYGDSATMASEAAVLGKPAIFIDNAGRGYNYELEKKYGLVYNYSESTADKQNSIEKAKEIILQYNTDDYLEKQKKMLSEKINTTSFILWFIENYPQSHQIMKENPDYQYNFR